MTQAAWAYLSRVVEGPSRPLEQLFRAGRGVEEIVKGIKTRASWLGELGPATQSRYQLDQSHKDLEVAEAVGARLLSPDDPQWPRECWEMSFGFAASAQSEHVRAHQADAIAPHALWVKGGNLSALIERSVSVVGTRTVSSYGKAATRMMVQGLVPHQWVVISGGAKGVDTVAHETALASGAKTVAVLACGVDKAYPASNAQLFENIATSQGCVVSEYPPATPPQRHRFLTRNRLVAAMSQGTILAQAPWRSGALNTMTWAEALGKVAMAIPGPITTNDFVGSHARIKDGRAAMVTSADDVRGLLERLGTVDPDAQLEMDFAASPIQALSRNELRVYDALEPLRMCSAEEVAQSAGLSIALTVHLLVELQRRELVERHGAAWGRRT